MSDQDLVVPSAPPYTARDLIIASYYLSGIRAKDAQMVTGADIEQGLHLLNRLLNIKQAQTKLIPYFQYNTSFYTAQNQESYFLKYCASIQSVTFNYATVRFPLRKCTANQYLAGARANNVYSLPYEYMSYRVDGGTIIKLYFVPMQQWQLSIYGKFFLLDVCLDTNLADTYDGSYLEYLHWALAEYICMQFNIKFGAEKERRMKEIEEILSYQAAPDPSVSKISILQKPFSTSWSFYNFFKGFVP